MLVMRMLVIRMPVIRMLVMRVPVLLVLLVLLDLWVILTCADTHACAGKGHRGGAGIRLNPIDLRYTTNALNRIRC